MEENKTLFDIVQTTLDLTLQSKGSLYVLYDQFGAINLTNIKNMRLDGLIRDDTAEDYDYTSSIDGDTYNKVKLTYDNKTTGARDIYIVKDGANINKWGVLQYFDKLQDNENGKAKADALLKLYNKKTRNLTVSNAIGDVRVRAGSLVPVALSLGDVTVNNYMLVEKVKHTFNENQHTMDLTLLGGDFVA